MSPRRGRSAVARLFLPAAMALGLATGLRTARAAASLILSASESCTVTIDGSSVGAMQAGQMAALDVAAGPHALSAETADHRTFSRALTLIDRQSISVDIVFPAAPPSLPMPTPAFAPTEDSATAPSTIAGFRQSPVAPAGALPSGAELTGAWSAAASGPCSGRTDSCVFALELVVVPVQGRLLGTFRLDQAALGDGRTVRNERWDVELAPVTASTYTCRSTRATVNELAPGATPPFDRGVSLTIERVSDVMIRATIVATWIENGVTHSEPLPTAMLTRGSLADKASSPASATVARTPALPPRPAATTAVAARRDPPTALGVLGCADTPGSNAGWGDIAGTWQYLETWKSRQLAPAEPQPAPESKPSRQRRRDAAPAEAAPPVSVSSGSEAWSILVRRTDEGLEGEVRQAYQDESSTEGSKFQAYLWKLPLSEFGDGLFFGSAPGADVLSGSSETTDHELAVRLRQLDGDRLCATLSLAPVPSSTGSSVVSKPLSQDITLVRDTR